MRVTMLDECNRGSSVINGIPRGQVGWAWAALFDRGPREEFHWGGMGPYIRRAAWALAEGRGDAPEVCGDLVSFARALHAYAAWALGPRAKNEKHQPDWKALQLILLAGKFRRLAEETRTKSLEDLGARVRRGSSGRNSEEEWVGVEFGGSYLGSGNSQNVEVFK